MQVFRECFRIQNWLILLSLPLWIVSCGGQSSGTSSSNESASESAESSSSSSVYSSSSASSTSSSEKKLVLAINSGGQSATYEGMTFTADQFWVGGTANTTSDPIANTDEDRLFQSERYGTFSYEIPVTNGVYDLRFFFNELYQTSAESRIFDVSVEGNAVLTDLDLFSLHGHDAAAADEALNIVIEDGGISIAFRASVDNATVSGIAIYSDTGEIVEPEYKMVAARNPVIWADVPDVSVIRVGETYYMSSTTMHMNPGVPIMKSTDLVNWTLINYAHQALDANNARLNLDPQQEAYGEGSWASSIRFVDGTFYVSTFSNTTSKTYIYSTQDIENGPWQTRVLNNHLHDSSLFFDGGKAYMVYGVDDIRIVELNSGLTALQQGGVNQVLIPKASSIAGTSFYVTAEGAQIQKINDWYYVNLISWPRGSSRSQLVYRSRNLLGPYEGQVVLQAAVAQGKMIDTPQGEWWALLFKDSGAVGRIPYLVPVKWQNNWPVLGVNGSVPDNLGFQVEDRGISGVIRSDEFSSPALDLAWQWNHNPDATGWSLTDRPGFLRLKNRRLDSAFVATQNTLTQRMYGPTSSARVALDVSNMKDGDVAGLGALQDKYGYVGVSQEGGRRSIVMVRNVNGQEQVIERINSSSSIVYFRVDGDFRNQLDEARFFYSEDGENWQSIGDVLEMEYLLTHFMGYRFSLFNYASNNVGGYVDFDYFRLD